MEGLLCFSWVFAATVGSPLFRRRKWVQGYSFGCILQPHHKMPLNCTHLTSKVIQKYGNAIATVCTREENKCQIITIIMSIIVVDVTLSYGEYKFLLNWLHSDCLIIYSSLISQRFVQMSAICHSKSKQ